MHDTYQVIKCFQFITIYTYLSSILLFLSCFLAKTYVSCRAEVLMPLVCPIMFLLLDIMSTIWGDMEGHPPTYLNPRGQTMFVPPSRLFDPDLIIF